MHITAGRIISYRRMPCCDKHIHMMWRRQDVAIASRCLEETFSITGEEKEERIEVVEVFKYLGWILEWSDNDCLVVLRNIRKSRQVWGRLGKLLQREGAEPSVLEKFYHTVVQVVLLFGA